jgi:hypothetical protein
MSKVVLKEFRPTREIKLPSSGVTIVCFPSVLVKDLAGHTVESTSDLLKNIELLTKLIQSWDLYENEADETPMPITAENLQKLPATDFEVFATELTAFASEQKKS